jgi:hypothetical protein
VLPMIRSYRNGNGGPPRTPRLVGGPPGGSLGVQGCGWYARRRASLSVMGLPTDDRLPGLVGRKTHNAEPITSEAGLALSALRADTRLSENSNGLQ